MGEMNERNRDLTAYLQGIEASLRGKPCKNRRRKKGKCLGRHDDCKNQRLFDKVTANAGSSPLFVETQEGERIAGEDVEERIARMQLLYAGKPPVFDEQEQVAPVNVRKNHGKTPLHQAVEDRNEAKVADLLASGADWGLKDNNGKTPLGVAILLGNTKMTRLLKRHGATK